MNYNFLPLYPNDNYYFVVPSVFYVYYPYPMFSQVCDNLPSTNHLPSPNNHSIFDTPTNNNLIDLTKSNVFQKTQINCIKTKTIKKHKIKKKKKNIVLVKEGFLNRKVNSGKRNSNKKLNKLIKNDIFTINNAKSNEEILTRKKDIKSSYFNYEKEMEKVYQDKFMLFMLRNFPNNFTFENFYISKHIRSKRKYHNAIEDMKTLPVPCDSSQCKKVWSPEYNGKNDVDNYIKSLTKINENRMNEEDMVEFLKENNYNTNYTLFLVKANDIKYQEFVNSKNKLN